MSELERRIRRLKAERDEALELLAQAVVELLGVERTAELLERMKSR